VNPSLLQINTKVLLSEIGPSATLDSIPDTLLDEAAEQGFDWVWLLGVWTLGAAGREISRSRPAWRREYMEVLPDLSTDDICGSPFAVCDYSPAPDLGGIEALGRFRERLSQRGMRLLLDFVPNHIALDHPWVGSHPEFLMAGSERDIALAPNDWVRLADGKIFAHGRDPYFPGWPDTLQLNYFNPQLREEMLRQLHRVAALCDGIRCDMAMLLEPEVFSRTWHGRNGEHSAEVPLFWPSSIRDVKAAYPHFVFMAEVYWDYEEKLQLHGFDYTYDKQLYDKILESSASAVNNLLRSPLTYQQKMVRFLENHDEPRIASRASRDQACAAALISYLTPGMRFFYRGQLSGSKVRVPVHLRRAPPEAPDLHVVAFYEKLLPIVNSPLGKSGAWQHLESATAWAGNTSNSNFVSFLLTLDQHHLLVSVNLAPYRGQCRIKLPSPAPSRSAVCFQELLTGEHYERAGRELSADGLFIDLPGYGGHILSFTSDS
jgi:glycosidase